MACDKGGTTARAYNHAGVCSSLVEPFVSVMVYDGFNAGGRVVGEKVGEDAVVIDEDKLDGREWGRFLEVVYAEELGELLRKAG
jgi:hypothetical protein